VQHNERPGRLGSPIVAAEKQIRTLLTVHPRSAPPSDLNPRVQVFPSPNGTVLITGVTLAGAWVAEYRCLAADFDERCVAAMERRVVAKERATLAIVP
jgi:hypothetical protein